MDHENTIQRLTPEILDAIISAMGLWDSRAEGSPAEHALLQDRSRLIEIMRESGRLSELLQAQVEILTTIDASMPSIEGCFEDWFLLGWHARGTIEDAEKMKGL